jgi:hypothetical protein
MKAICIFYKTLKKAPLFLIVAIMVTGPFYGQRKPAPEVFIADFNNDKIADTVKVIYNLKPSPAQRKWILCNPFSERDPASVEPLAFLFSLSKMKKCYLVHDSSFFAAPGWQSGTISFNIVKPGDRKFRSWKRSVINLKGAAIELGTEAGIDILLYWERNKFRLYWPDEEP